jgi:hypothetical protein
VRIHEGFNNFAPPAFLSNPCSQGLQRNASMR